jgi:hypothetical protein
MYCERLGAVAQFLKINQTKIKPIIAEMSRLKNHL